MKMCLFYIKEFTRINQEQGENRLENHLLGHLARGDYKNVFLGFVYWRVCDECGNVDARAIRHPPQSLLDDLPVRYRQRRLVSSLPQAWMLA